MQLDRHGGIEHIPESQSGLGGTVIGGMVPAFHRDALTGIRNYALCGNYDAAGATLSGMMDNQTTPSDVYLGYNTTSYGLAYNDASGFVLWVSLAKKDYDNFVCGVDCSMSGTLTANLYFGQDAPPTVSGTSFDPGEPLQRGIQVRYWILTHGCLNLQRGAITYRN
jgi:hypothetical protein